MSKKNYIAPVVEELAYAPVLLVGSALENGDGYVEGEGTDQLSSEYRSDWENIWGDM